MKAFIHLESEIASLIDKWFKLGILCCVMNHRQLGTCTIRDREFPSIFYRYGICLVTLKYNYQFEETRHVLHQQN